MRLIESKTELIQQPSGLEGVYKQIELCGRTCYKSEDKITEDSAKGFVDRMIKSNHTAMLEHGTVYLMIHTIAPEDWDKRIGRHKRLTIDDCREYLRINPTCNKNGEKNWWSKEARHNAHAMAVKYEDNPYSKVKIVLTKHDLNIKDGFFLTPTGGMPIISRKIGKIVSIFNTILITTNYRVLVENNWLDDLKYICEPTEYHERRYTLKLTTDRGVSHELVRHRVFSFAQESTRYCNYSKDKFNNELTFIKPSWKYTKTLVSKEGIPYNGIPQFDGDYFEDFLAQSEEIYFTLLDQGWAPQEARQVLPNALKTEICMTGFESDWKHFLDLRYFETTGKAHPDMKELATKIVEQFKNNNIKIGEIQNKDILCYKWS